MTPMAIGSAASLVIVLGAGYAGQKRRKQAFGQTEKSRPDPIEVDGFEAPPKLDFSPLDRGLGLPQPPRSDGDFPLPPGSGGDFPLPPGEEELPTGGASFPVPPSSQDKLGDEDVSSAASEAARRGVSPGTTMWGDLAKELKFAGADDDDADDDVRKKTSKARWGAVKEETLKHADESRSKRSMWTEVARDLKVKEDDIGKVTPELVEALAQQQAVRIEERRVEQQKRVDARRKKLAERHEARSAARSEAMKGELSSFRSMVAADAAELRANKEDKYAQVKAKPQIAKPADRALRRELSACKSDGAQKERPGRMGAGGRLLPDRNASAAADTSDLASEASSVASRKSDIEARKREIAARQAARKAGKALAGAEPYLGDYDGASPERPGLNRQSSACASSASKDGPLSQRSTGSSIESTQSQKERLEERRKALAERKAAVAAAKAGVATGDATQRSEWSAAGSAMSAETTASQRDRIEQRRAELAARQEKIAAAKAARAAGASPNTPSARSPGDVGYSPMPSIGKAPPPPELLASTSTPTSLTPSLERQNSACVSVRFKGAERTPRPPLANTRLLPQPPCAQTRCCCLS